MGAGDGVGMELSTSTSVSFSLRAGKLGVLRDDVFQALDGGFVAFELDVHKCKLELLHDLLFYDRILGSLSIFDASIVPAVSARPNQQDKSKNADEDGQPAA